MPRKTRQNSRRCLFGGALYAAAAAPIPNPMGPMPPLSLTPLLYLPKTVSARTDELSLIFGEGECERRKTQNQFSRRESVDKEKWGV